MNPTLPTYTSAPAPAPVDAPADTSDDVLDSETEEEDEEQPEPVDDCGNCGADIFEGDNSYTLANETVVCESCADRHVSSCSECHDYYYTDDLLVDRSDEYVCESCRDNGYGDFYETADNDTIYYHDVNPLRVLNVPQPDPTKLFYGFELELNTNDRELRYEAARRFISRSLGRGMVKSDGSIGDEDLGIELVSAPLSLDDIRFLVYSVLRNNKLHSAAYVDDTCGMHVHVSRAPLPLCVLAKLARFVHNQANYDFIQHLAGRDLIGHEYASINARSASWKELYRPPSGFDDGLRYVAINFSNYYTVEFRLFASTTDAARACANIETCAALVAFCGVAQHSIGKSDKAEAFIDFVKRERRSYPHLATLLSNANRTLAPVAH